MTQGIGETWGLPSREAPYSRWFCPLPLTLQATECCPLVRARLDFLPSSSHTTEVEAKAKSSLLRAATVDCPHRAHLQHPEPRT